MTPEVCYWECKNVGYIYYGLKNGNECHCGSKLNFNGNLAGEEVERALCNVPCKGDETQKCGGYDKISLYTKGSFF